MLAVAAPAPSPTAEPLAWRRHHDTVYAAWLRRKHTEDDPRHEPLDARSLAELRAAVQPIVRELAKDLERPDLGPHDRSATLEELGKLGGLASAATPTMIAVLHALDDDASYGIPYFCAATKALAQVAPKDPRVIRALADALEADGAKAGICHRCGCALDALREAGPAAEPIAGPVLERMARRFGAITTYQDQLGRAIEAIGGGRRMAATLIRRAADPRVLPDDRASTLRAVAKTYGQLSAADQEDLARTTAALLGNEYAPLRVAAAEALGWIDPPALEALTRALGDPHYQVRAAAARSAARRGPAALPLRGLLLDALDPLLGTAEAAAEALVAIGPGVLAELEARAVSAPAHLQPLFAATADAVRRGDAQRVREVLRRAFAHGPFDKGFVKIDVLSAGEGMAYDFHRHRIRVHFEGGVYGPGREQSRRARGTVTVDQPTSSFHQALQDRRQGDHLRMAMSPEVAQSPFYAVPDPSRPHELEHFLHPGAAAEFDVTIEKVCKPVIWTVFRGSGIFSPIKLELYCR